MAFDIQAARQEGYSDAQIRQFLLSQPGVADARKEGYSDNEILSHYGFDSTQVSANKQISNPLIRYPAMIGSEALRGLTGLAGLPGDFEQGLNSLGNVIQSKVGLPTQPNSQTNFPTSSQLLELTGRAGLTDRSDLIPGWGSHPALERYLASGTESLASTAPLALLGPADAIAPTLTSGLGAGLGSEFGREVGGSGTAETFGLLGGLGLGGAVGAGERGINALRGNFNPIARDFQLAGIPIRSPAYSIPSQHVAKMIGPGSAAEATSQDLGSAIESHAASLGQSRTFQQAGTVAQNEARDWLTTGKPGKEEAVWQPITDAIGSDAPSPLFSLVATLGQINKSGGNLQPIRDLIIPKLPKQMQQTFERILEDPTATKAVAPVTAPTGLTNSAGQPILREVSPGKPPEPITWGESRLLRTTIGDAMTNPKVVADIGMQNLKRIYAAITDDLGSTAIEHGVKPEFDAANAESSRLNNIAENIVGKIISGKNPAQETITPESAAKAALATSKKGGTILSSIRTELPHAADELAAVKLRQDLLSDPEDATSSIDRRAVTRWASLPDEAKQALFPNSGMRESLDAIERIGGRVHGIKGYALPSKLTAAGALMAGGGWLGENVLGLAGHLWPNVQANSLIPGEIGGTIGALAPLAGLGLRNALANSKLAARYFAGAPPQWAVPFQYPISAQLGTNPNALWPEKREGMEIK